MAAIPARMRPVDEDFCGDRGGADSPDPDEVVEFSRANRRDCRYAPALAGAACRLSTAEAARLNRTVDMRVEKIRLKSKGRKAKL